MLCQRLDACIWITQTVAVSTNGDVNVKRSLLMLVNGLFVCLFVGGEYA